jgi:hypothetical protein
MYSQALGIISHLVAWPYKIQTVASKPIISIFNYWKKAD